MKEQIVNCLNDKKKGESSKKLLVFLKEPKTPGEIQRLQVKGDVLELLVGLRSAEAITFADGKYFATPIGLEVLQTL